MHEREKKLRMMSVLKLTLNNQQFTLETIQDNWKEFIRLENVDAWPCYIPEENQNKADKYFRVIIYVAEYCAYSI